jgi:hypothetical protein
MFVDASNHDFHIQSGAPGVDAADTVGAVIADNDGLPRPQGGTPDLGAFERASIAAPVIGNVFVGTVTSDSAFIAWTTDVPATAYVQFGLTNAYTNTTPVDPNMVNLEAVQLSGLSPSTTYHFRAASQNASGGLALSQDFSFTTAPDSQVPPLGGVAPVGTNPQPPRILEGPGAR